MTRISSSLCARPTAIFCDVLHLLSASPLPDVWGIMCSRSVVCTSSRSQLQLVCGNVCRHASSSKALMQCFSSVIILFCMLLPAGVSACLPAPQPNGRTSLLRPFLSTTASASSGNFPPPSGCSRPRRTKWLFGGSTAEIMGSEYGAFVDSLWVGGSWQRMIACSEGERL